MQATSAPRAPSWVSRIAAIPATYPLVFGAVFTCAKTTGADAFVQLVMEKKTELDLKRISVFGGCLRDVLLAPSWLTVCAAASGVWTRMDGCVAALGVSCHLMAADTLMLTGVFQYYFYSVWLPRLFPGTVARGLWHVAAATPNIHASAAAVGMRCCCSGAASFAAKSLRAKLQDRTGMLAVGGQLVLEQALYVPFLFFPVYATAVQACVTSQPLLACSILPPCLWDCSGGSI